MKNVKNVKMVDSNFDRKTGISTVTLATPYGLFTGTAKLHPSETAYISKFIGCEYAEMRAYIKYCEARKREAKARLQGLQYYYNTVSAIKDFNKDSVEARRARRIIYEYVDEIEDWKNLITSMTEALNNKILSRDSAIDNLNKNRE